MSNALKAIVVAALAIGALSWFYLWPARPDQTATRPKAAGGLAAGGLAAAPEAHQATEAPDAPEAPARTVPLPTIDTSVPKPPASLEELVAILTPAVVRIETPSALGTGFFVQPDTILTNAHVVQDNTSVTIRRATGETMVARVETAAPAVDLAVLKVAAADATQPIIPLGSGRTARQGQEVVALGSPFGLQNTVTRGIVSAVREVGGVTLVQTDAAVNPGNSGGPLVDRNGRAIGVNSLGVRSAVAQGLSFAIAVEYAADLLAGRTPPAGTTPLNTLTQAMQGGTPPASNGRESAQTSAESTFDTAMAAIARRADALDEYWRRFVPTCYQGRITGSFSREWFALFDARAMPGLVAPGCSVSFEELRQRANGIAADVRALDERAREADIYPGTRRDARRRYRLDYAGWDR
jgi:hypothetical protein